MTRPSGWKAECSPVGIYAPESATKKNNADMTFASYTEFAFQNNQLVKHVGHMSFFVFVRLIMVQIYPRVKPS